jgi:hypothetical protein
MDSLFLYLSTLVKYQIYIEIEGCLRNIACFFAKIFAGFIFFYFLYMEFSTIFHRNLRASGFCEKSKL